MYRATWNSPKNFATIRADRRSAGGIEIRPANRPSDGATGSPNRIKSCFIPAPTVACLVLSPPDPTRPSTPGLEYLGGSGSAKALYK